MNSEEMNPEWLEKGIRKRKEQLANLQHWVSTRERYSLQINFCVPGTADHCCVTISGKNAPKMARVAISHLERHIASLEERKSNTAQI